MKFDNFSEFQSVIIDIFRQDTQQTDEEKVEAVKHVYLCEKSNFTIFQFMQLHANVSNLQLEHVDLIIEIG